MATSRRNFLKTGIMGVLCAAVPAVLAKVAVGRPAALGGFPGANAKSFIEFTRDTFAPHINTTFCIRTGSSAVDLRLTEIADLKAISKTPARIAGKESFSLLFVGSGKSSRLKQDTYIVEHAVLGRFSLFLVPVGKPNNRHHEAIIVRL
ncbi:MAG: DUF6916 family protein [Pyrinomonadaceae bacterium]